MKFQIFSTFSTPIIALPHPLKFHIFFLFWTVPKGALPSHFLAKFRPAFPCATAPRPTCASATGAMTEAVICSPTISVPTLSWYSGGCSSVLSNLSSGRTAAVRAAVSAVSGSSRTSTSRIRSSSSATP